MKKISVRQIIIFYFIYSFAIKFLMLPHFLSGEAGRDAWIAAGLGALVELCVLWLVLLVMSADREEDVYSGLRSPFLGKPVLVFMSAFFLVQTLITLSHTNYLLANTLYENLNIHMLIIPMLVLGIFFCYSKTRAVLRSGEIFYILIIVSVSLAVIPSLWKIDIGETLPVLAKGLKPVFRTFYNNLIYFEAAFVLLMFKGEVDIKQRFKCKFMLCASIGAVLFVVFIFFFYSLFGPLASSRALGVADVAGQNSYLSQGGRLEWIIVCVWLLLLALRFGVLFYCCFAAVRYVIPVKKFQPAMIVFPMAIGIYALFLLISLNAVLSALRPFVLGFYVLVPLLFLGAGINSSLRLSQRRTPKGGA